MHRILWCAVAVLASSPALAQDDDTVEVPEGRLYKYKERTEIDFHGVEISGTAVGPDLIVHFLPARPIFNPLIKVRADWDHELADSVDEIR